MAVFVSFRVKKDKEYSRFFLVYLNQTRLCTFDQVHLTFHSSWFEPAVQSAKDTSHVESVFLDSCLDSDNHHLHPPLQRHSQDTTGKRGGGKGLNPHATTGNSLHHNFLETFPPPPTKGGGGGRANLLFSLHSSSLFPRLFARCRLGAGRGLSQWEMHFCPDLENPPHPNRTRARFTPPSPSSPP